MKPCHYCKKPVDASVKAGNFKKVVGWSQVRSRGGVHQIAFREDLDEYMHKECVDLLKMGISPDQQQLFERLDDGEQ